MTHFEWRIDYLKKYSSLGEHSNIVYQVGYTCTGINTSGILTDRYTFGGSVGLSTESLVSPIAYASLTEDNVQGWVSSVKPEVQSTVEEYINGGDDVEVVNFPWE